MNDREFCSELRRYSDRICNYIFHMDLDWIDVEIQVAEMRDFCEKYRPEKMDLFEMIYVSRFRRLWEAWAPGNVNSWDWLETEYGN